MGHKTVAALAVLTLSACGAGIPDSNPNAGGGVGFSNYESYQSNQARAEQLAAQRAARDAELEGRVAANTTEEQAIAADTLTALNVSAPDTSLNISTETQVATGAPSAPTGPATAQAALPSSAVQVDAPQAIPERPRGSTAPNVVTYALGTNNPVGQPLYPRSRRNQNRVATACAEFVTSDQAQAAFLAAGGPERDRRGLDPDGDGFACGWDPRPFRAARGG